MWIQTLDAELGTARNMNPSNSGTANAMSPCAKP
jgi:hypothetical protein